MLNIAVSIIVLIICSIYFGWNANYIYHDLKKRKRDNHDK